MKKFYITTTIPYTNDSPHIGFALEIIQADVLARWHRQKGEDVFFLTGTDEHGTKNYQTARKQGLTPKQFVDRIAAQFRELTKVLNISNNYFIRTTDKKIHWPGVTKMWKALYKSGDIHKKEYTGSYCSGCERFITRKELVNGKCPNHPTREIEYISETNYFFKLSKYSDKIRNLIKSGKYNVQPQIWRNGFLALIKDGLQDVSFSRDKKHLPWGIPVPNDPEQVMYVWCDALTNYLTGIGYPNKKYTKYWPADIHVGGKDMLRFHAGIWPGMLLSAGFPLPKNLFIHGFITAEGQKMSKSVGNIVNPFEEVKKFSADAIRYYLIREIPSNSDGDYSKKAVVERYNNELANDLGNLVSRGLSLIEKGADGKVPKGKIDSKLDKLAKSVQKKSEAALSKFELHRAIESVWELIKATNKYIQDNKPWEKPKNLNDILFNIANSLRIICALVYPFIPSSAEEIAKQIGIKKVPKFAELKKPVKVGTKVKKGEILFKKLEVKKEETKNKLKVKPMINFKEFEKLDLRVGKIVHAEEVPKSKKLIKMKVDFGAETKQVVAGIKQYYKPKDLKGKQAVFVVNLEPAKIMGLTSEAMILAASDKNKVSILSPDKKIKTGSGIS